MRTLIRFVITFLAITGAVLVATTLFGMQFSHADYWDRHGIFFLLFLTLFPRLTLLFGGVATGGLIWWLAWLFTPRFLVAVLATLAYWYSNPFLVVIAWLVAFGGETSEKYVVVRRSRWKPRSAPREAGFESAKWVDSEKVD